MPRNISTEELHEKRLKSGVPLFNDQKMKLGIFGSNCSYGLMASNVPSTYEVTWEHTKKIAQKADNMGFEAMVPIARYKGMGGPSNFNGENYETHTWAAGLAEATENIMLFSTIHVPAKHPVVTAKESVTVDHISNGRFGLNVTMGWYGTEMGMFGGKQRPHDERYAYGKEYMEVLKKLWTEKGEFSYKGKYFDLDHLEAEPKPIQDPYPVLVNAGNSPAGLDFCARECDYNFIAFKDFEEAKETSSKVKEMAKDRYKKQLGILGYGNIICRETEKETKELYDQILKMGDWEVAEFVQSGLGSESQSFEQIKALQERFITGYGGYPIIGTPEQVVDQLVKFSEAGVDGMLLGFLDYVEELDFFEKRILPLMKQAGLRY